MRSVSVPDPRPSTEAWLEAVPRPADDAAPVPATRVVVNLSAARLAGEADARAHEEAAGRWGFADTAFTLHADKSVSLSGGRYGLCGARLPYLVPWIEGVLGEPLPPSEAQVPRPVAPPPPPRPAAGFLAALAERLEPSQISDRGQVRLAHSHGHTLGEIWQLNYSGRALAVVDYVIFARQQADVEHVVRAALAHGVCVVPYGGGTNVTEALAVPPAEARAVVSLDLRGLDRLLWIDPVNRTACIEAGARGRHIAAALRQYGLTLGHEPDSIEFSTLGGWIATHASGMKKNKYGNIEQVILDMTVVGADGTLARASAPPRCSVGIDGRALMFGSEGRLGVITQAVVKLAELPEVEAYDSVLFANMEAGVEFMYALSQAESLPASVRLVDPMQFQFGYALRAPKRGLGWLRGRLERFWVERVRRLDRAEMAACTLVFAGSRQGVRAHRKRTMALARQLGGMPAGATNGQRGYQMTFAIAYIRDFLLRHHIYAESFETSVPWSGVMTLIEQVRRQIGEAHQRLGLPGRPVVLSRVTQIYGSGACVYFYLALYLKGVADPCAAFAEVELAAREAILAADGSLSHHHGVGKAKEKFLPRVMNEASLRWVERLKGALDPHNVFGCDNQRVRPH